MNDAGVIAARVSGGTVLSAPLSQASPTADNAAATIFENGIRMDLPFPLYLRVDTPSDTPTYKNFRQEPVFEARGCKDDYLDGVADNSTCGSRAIAINNNGFVVGSSHTNASASASYFEKAMLWSDGIGQNRSSVAGKAEVMPYSTLSAWASSQQFQAEGLNESRTIVGTGITNSGTGPNDSMAHGLVEYGDGRATNKSVYIGEQYRSSHAHAVNESHDVAGGIYTSATDARWQIMKYSSAGTINLGGFLTGGNYSEGFSINDGGDIVGAATNSNGQMRAVLWKNSTSLTDMGTLGGVWSVARSISNTGDIVGSATNSSGAQHGFIYQNGTMYDLNSYASVSGWTIVDAYTINANGQILVRAAKNGAYDNAYWLLSPNVDQGGTIGTSYHISGNSTATANVDGSGDIDMFKIIAPIAGKITASTTGSSTTAILLDASGNSLTNYDVGPGTYYVKVTSTAASGAYTLNTTWLPDDGLTPSTATRVDPTSTTAASIRSAGDVDYFKVYIAKTGTLTVKTTGTTPTYGKLLYLTSAGAEVLVTEANGGTGNFTFTNDVKPGIYFIKVTHASGGTGAYDLSLSCPTCVITYPSDDFGNTPETAATLAVGSSLNGRFETGTDVDWFKVTTPATNADGTTFSGSLIVYTRAGEYYCSSTGASDTFGDLYDNSGKVLLTSNSKGDCTRNMFLRQYAVGAQTFYVRVRPEWNATGDYQIYAAIYEKDLPDLRVQAKDVGDAPTAISDSFWNAGIGYDRDYLALPLKRGTYTWNTTGGTAYLEGIGGALLRAFGAFPTGLAPWAGSTPVSFNICTNGIYYTQIQGSSGSFTFNGNLVNDSFTGYGDKCDDTLDTAQVVSASSVNSDAWEDLNPDFYKISAKRGKLTVSLSNVVGESVSPYLYILDDKGVSKADRGGSTASATIDVCADGTYYIKTNNVSQYNSAKYTLTISNPTTTPTCN